MSGTRSSGTTFDARARGRQVTHVHSGAGLALPFDRCAGSRQTPRAATLMALSDLRVLELATHVAGPFCGRLFADFGADVVKLETARGGDDARREGPFPRGSAGPESSGLFLYLNGGKRSVALDIESADGLDTFRSLLADADVVLESYPPGTMERLGLGFSALERLRPGIILTSVSGWGQWGPWRDLPATDILHYAASGLASVNGTADREPLKHPGPQPGYQAGAAAFAATLTAVCHRDLDGVGQHVDVAALEVAAAMLAPYLTACAYTGRSLARAAAGDVSRPPASTPLLPCLDGYVSLSPRSNATWQALWDFFGEPQVAEDPRFATVADRRKNASEMHRLLAPYMARFKMAELFHALAPLRVLVGMTLDIEALVNDPHLQARRFYTSSEHPVAGTLVMPGPPFKLSRTPGGNRRPAPLLGQHTDEVLNEGTLSRRGPSLGGPPVSRIQAGRSAGGLALGHVRAVALTQAWGGAMATQLLADMGAEVIQVESTTRLDPWRGAGGEQGTFPGDVPGERPYNRQAYYNTVNRNKLGVTLDLASSEGRAIFLDLVRVSDVVAENFAARVMDNLGLGYDVLRGVNPTVVMLRMPAFGCDGPYSDYSGNGGSIEPMTGLSHLLGYEDGPPMNSGVMYPDPVAAIMAFGAMLIALHHRSRTGVGQLIDLSQQETLLALLGDRVLEHTYAGRSPTRRGNAHPWMSPHGIYPCAGDDEWVAIAVRSDLEWKRLCRAAGRADWADDVRLSAAAGRRRHRKEVDRMVETWTSTLAADRVERLLQDAEVPASRVLDAQGVLDNPQLRARGFFETVRHPEAGSHPLAGVPWKLSRTPGRIRSPAPCLGEHNELVLRRYLGLTEAEVARLAERGVIGEQPAPR